MVPNKKGSIYIQAWSSMFLMFFVELFRTFKRLGRLDVPWIAKPNPTHVQLGSINGFQQYLIAFGPRIAKFYHDTENQYVLLLPAYFEGGLNFTPSMMTPLQRHVGKVHEVAVIGVNPMSVIVSVPELEGNCMFHCIGALRMLLPATSNDPFLTDIDIRQNIVDVALAKVFECAPCGTPFIEIFRIMKIFGDAELNDDQHPISEDQMKTIRRENDARFNKVFEMGGNEADFEELRAEYVAYLHHVRVAGVPACSTLLLTAAAVWHGGSISLTQIWDKQQGEAIRCTAEHFPVADGVDPTGVNTIHLMLDFSDGGDRRAQLYGVLPSM